MFLFKATFPFNDDRTKEEKCVYVLLNIVVYSYLLVLNMRNSFCLFDVTSEMQIVLLSGRVVQSSDTARLSIFYAGSKLTNKLCDIITVVRMFSSNFLQENK